MWVDRVLPIIATVQVCHWDITPRRWWIGLGQSLRVVQIRECFYCSPCPVLTRQADELIRMQDHQTDWLLREAADRELYTHLYGPDLGVLHNPRDDDFRR